MKSFLGVPLFVRGEVFGNLYLTDKQGEDGFSDIDEELVLGLAAAAALVINNAHLQQRTAELSLLADRERIGRDLHDAGDPTPVRDRPRHAGHRPDRRAP